VVQYSESPACAEEVGKVSTAQIGRREILFAPVNSCMRTGYSRGTCTCAADCTGYIPSVRSTLTQAGYPGNVSCPPKGQSSQNRQHNQS